MRMAQAVRTEYSQGAPSRAAKGGRNIAGPSYEELAHQAAIHAFGRSLLLV